MVESVSNTSKSQNLDDLLHAFMGLIKSEHMKSVREAGEGQSMLEMGVKTEYAQEWEMFLKNPVESMYKMRQQLDGSMKSFIDFMVSTVLKSKAQLISKAFSVESSGNNFFYCISLKEDTLENRINLNNFFRFYEKFSISNDYPVFFQYVPDELMKNIKSQKTIVG